MMNTLKRKVKSAYTKKTTKLLLKIAAVMGLGFCAILNALCLWSFFLPMTVYASFSFEHRNILHYVYHKHSCLKKHI